MIMALTIAVIVQWVLLILFAVMLVALLRQVGMLHDRLGPVGALTLPGGPKVHEPAPVFDDLIALDGRTVSIGGENGVFSTLLFFLSPHCPICKSLIPVIKSIAREQGPALRVILASDGDADDQADMVRRHKLEAFPLILSTQLGLTYQVSKLPHAVLIDQDGKLVSKGLVNNREHLESLFEAKIRGVASLQEFRKQQPASVAERKPH